MAHRLTTIITRSGDQGQTSLGNGSRTSKNSPRIKAMGHVDELNSALGVLRCEDLPENLQSELNNIQNDLFDLGSELCMPGQIRMEAGQTLRLESVAKELNATLPPLQEFILPGGCRAAALAQWCRAVCRRAERSLIQLADSEEVPEESRRYLNRLSDLLFILGRHLNQIAGHAEAYWQKRG